MAGRRPKLRDISERAGVSKATVDRVLNNRTGVQDHTRRHVLSIVAELSGALPTPDVKPNALRLDFVIPDRHNAFMGELITKLEDQARQRDDIAVAIHHLAGIDAPEIVAALKRVGETGRAVGLVAQDNQDVRQAVRDLCKRAIPVVTLASDIGNVPRTAYVGIDNHAAGRLAGYLTGRLSGGGDGSVALVLGSRAYRGHEEREMGFRSVLRERYPGFRIVAEREVHEDIQTAYREVGDVLRQHRDLDGIYCIGAGQPGVARALIDGGRADMVTYVGHGLSDDTRVFLRKGVMDVVIDEDTAVEADEAVRLLTAAALDRETAPPRPVRIQAIFAENIPVQV